MNREKEVEGGGVREGGWEGGGERMMEGGGERDWYQNQFCKTTKNILADNWVTLIDQALCINCDCIIKWLSFRQSIYHNSVWKEAQNIWNPWLLFVSLCCPVDFVSSVSDVVCISSLHGCIYLWRERCIKGYVLLTVRQDIYLFLGPH